LVQRGNSDPASALSYVRALALAFDLALELEVTEISSGELLHGRV
jgi:hypothetical protein